VLWRDARPDVIHLRARFSTAADQRRPPLMDAAAAAAVAADAGSAATTWRHGCGNRFAAVQAAWMRPYGPSVRSALRERTHPIAHTQLSTGVAIYGALGHVPPPTSNNLFFCFPLAIYKHANLMTISDVTYLQDFAYNRHY